MSDMIVPSPSLSICVAWERTNFVVKMRRPGEREQNIQQFLFFHSKRNETINIRFRHTHKHTSILYVDTRIKKQIIQWDRETICLFKSRKHFQSLSLLCFCLFILLLFFSFGLQQTMAICVCVCVYFLCVKWREGTTFCFQRINDPYKSYKCDFKINELWTYLLWQYCNFRRDIRLQVYYRTWNSVDFYSFRSNVLQKENEKENRNNVEKKWLLICCCIVCGKTDNATTNNN